jgi:hypothetical protein
MNVEINLFTSTFMFNQIRARPLATMVAKTASIVVGGSQRPIWYKLVDKISENNNLARYLF